jgi:glucan 1,4-alpha-glucosidase
MQSKFIYTLLIIGVLSSSCLRNTEKSVTSPDGKLQMTFKLDELNRPTYEVHFNELSILQPSGMSFEFTDSKPLLEQLEIIATDEAVGDENWEMPWGEKRLVKNNYNELSIMLKEKAEPFRSWNIIFRMFNDGIAFRYEFPEQPGLTEFQIAEERTEFNLAGDHTCWWIPGDWDIYEHLYTTSKFSEIDAIVKRNHPALAQSYIPENAVNTPVTMKSDEGIYLSFHEARLSNYSGMTLKINKENTGMVSNLVGSERSDYKVKRELPFKTPWRTIQISDRAGGLIESDLIVNLNDPNKLGDIYWFKPMKYMGIWWDMHLGRRTWDMASGNHGATTEYAKELIDFASENRIGGVLVEGWNTGWEHWIGFEEREGVFDFVTPYEDYDLEEVVKYGKEKGVDIIMHHETSSAPKTYDEQLDTAFALMQSLGIHTVKTGYVGKIIPKGEYHHGQWMVNHYRRVLETAAKYEIAINAHEPIKATGIRRTLPNAISREGLRGQEFNAWSPDGGNPPEHLPIVAFTRMLAGPIDFTPGIFNIKLDPYKENNQINTTIAHQLALYVVISSPIQMAADLIDNYKNEPAFQFIRDVGVNWEQTKVLDGEIGDFVIIAREERETGNWFIGGITDEESRQVSICFDFLQSDVSYRARIYRDGNKAHWDKNPRNIIIEEIQIDSTKEISIDMAEGGGFAISLLAE